MTIPACNTVFLRLEGPLQSWGDTSKFVVRRSMDAPTKSGVLGLICCAMGLSRQAAREQLPEFNTLIMDVRIDRPGMRWWDYQTVGAKTGILKADGKGIKYTSSTGEIETLITRREYLADASFLVALQGDQSIIQRVADALRAPRWQIYLGRKCCPPAVPVLTQPCKDEAGLWANPMYVERDAKAALDHVPWRARYKSDPSPNSVDCLVEWRAAGDEDVAPPEAEVWYDVPYSFNPPVHHPRLVMRDQVKVNVGSKLQQRTPAPPRPRADYTNSEYKKRRATRLVSDLGLCVFCKNTATTVQHITYRRAGGNEVQGDLRALCRLCHDAVTMIEYGMGMGRDRIDPCEPRWRDDILKSRSEILHWRSEESRRRALRSAPERVRKELLEEEN